jgi:DNA-binding NarL/FixJ family response regulator
MDMKKVRILVADDHDVVRVGVRAMLERRPEWEVCSEAVTGRDAVEKAKRLKPDVVVLDANLPEFPGVEAPGVSAKCCGYWRRPKATRRWQPP